MIATRNNVNLMISLPESKTIAEKIRAPLLRRLQIIDHALTQKQTGRSQVESNTLTDSEITAISAAAKYIDVAPTEQNSTPLTDLSQSRQAFLNENEEPFSDFFSVLQVFINKVNRVFPDKGYTEKKDIDKENKLRKTIVLGSIFSTYPMVSQCRDALNPILKKIKMKNLFELETLSKLPQKSKEDEERIQQLALEKVKITLEIDVILKKFITSDSVKEKIKKLMFRSENTQIACIKLLEDMRSCVKLFDYFRRCISLLNISGFYTVNGRRVNFWCGTDAQQKANTVLTSVSDSNVPAFAIFSYIALFLRDIDRNLSDAIFLLISAEFTKQATGDVEIYNSTSSEDENDVFPVGNFHWEIEEEVLIILQFFQKVGKFKVFNYQHHGETRWPEIPKILFEDNMYFVNRRRSDPNLDSKQNLEKRRHDEKKGLPRKFFYLDVREHSNSKEPSPDSSPKSSLTQSPELTPRNISTPEEPLSPRLYRIINKNTKKLDKPAKTAPENDDTQSQSDVQINIPSTPIASSIPEDNGLIIIINKISSNEADQENDPPSTISETKSNPGSLTPSVSSLSELATLEKDTDTTSPSGATDQVGFWAKSKQAQKLIAENSNKPQLEIDENREIKCPSCVIL